MGNKIPISVLVLIHTEQNEVLLLERAGQAGFWQSVTGSIDSEDEPLLQTAIREVLEETGIAIGHDCPFGALQDLQQSHQYEIFQQWRHRYPDGVTHNTEHVFRLCLPQRLPIALQEREHSRYQWLSAHQAAPLCFSPSNAQAILDLIGLCAKQGTGA